MASALFIDRRPLLRPRPFFALLGPSSLAGSVERRRLRMTDGRLPDEDEAPLASTGACSRAIDVGDSSLGVSELFDMGVCDPLMDRLVPCMSEMLRSWAGRASCC